MYGVKTSLVLVFLTHPGILLPISAPGAWSWLRGLWQASWATGLQAFSEGKYSFWAEVVFAAIFLLWTGVQVSPYIRDL